MEFGVIEEIRCFLDEESGGTAIEYGLVLAVISLTIIGAVTSIGDDVTSIFTTANSSVQGAISGG